MSHPPPVVTEYEDSNEPGSAMGLAPEPSVIPTHLPPLLLELRWLPPHAPTSYDGFNIYLYRDGELLPWRGNSAECQTKILLCKIKHVHLMCLGPPATI